MLYGVLVLNVGGFHHGPMLKSRCVGLCYDVDPSRARPIAPTTALSAWAHVETHALHHAQHPRGPHDILIPNHNLFTSKLTR
jgi:hypothetical protein